MKKPIRPLSITDKDLRNFTLKQADRQKEFKRLQRFLDDTNTRLEVDRLTEAELEKVREVVDNPAAALASPNVLIWNNICRQRCGLFSQSRFS